MPVSKHRRRSKIRPRQPEPWPEATRQNGMTLDELHQAIDNPTRDFRAKAIVAGVWWYRRLLGKLGDHGQRAKISREDKLNAALLLCLAIDGAHGENDDISPVIAEMLRPYCSAPTFAEAWEQANRMPAGTALAAAASLLAPPAGSDP